MTKAYRGSIAKLRVRLRAIGYLDGGDRLDQALIAEAGVDELTIEVLERRLAGESLSSIGKSFRTKGFRGASLEAVRWRIEAAIRRGQEVMDRQKVRRGA